MKDRWLSLMRVFARGLTSVRCWWCVCLVWAAILAWAGRDAMNPDGVSYLDMASGTLSHGPAQLVSANWSPGYPAIVALVFMLFHPSTSQEFPLVHLINFVIFVLVLWAFTFFLRSWLRADIATEVDEHETARYITPLAFGMFLWFTMEFIGLDLVTPDLLVAAMVFVAAGMVCRLSRSGSTGLRPYVLLGLALGLGYYAKTVLFPSGLALLAVLFLVRPNRNLSRKGLLASGLVFLAVAAPLVALISARVGRVSIGEAGRLSYIWYVNHRNLLSHNYWEGNFGKAYATLEHPPRMVMERPMTIEFSTPLPGTFPLWYDPPYWWQGEAARLDWRQQIVALEANLGGILPDMKVVILGSLVLLILATRRKVAPIERRSRFWLVAWPLAVCSMLALVRVENRYLAPFLVLFWLAVYRTLMLRVNVRTRATILAGVLSMLLVPQAVVLASAAAIAARNRRQEPEYRTIARGLTELGIHGGDRLAVVGYAFDSYYARFARVQVTADVEDADEFWRLSEADLKRLEDRLAASGVKALVARNRPAGSWPERWRDLDGTKSARFSVLLLGERRVAAVREPRSAPIAPGGKL